MSFWQSPGHSSFRLEDEFGFQTFQASGAYAVRETAGLGGAAFAADVRLVHANAVCFCERAVSRGGVS